MNHRQLEQKSFDESGQNLIVGSANHCPIPPDQLAQITSDSPYVIETFDSGLTATVYHLSIAGNHFTLKKKRTTSKVKNLDGKYSFLNEVQRRHDLQARKDDPTTSNEFRHIVSTIYADYRQGIILSDWIEGNLLARIERNTIAQLFSTLLSCEKTGLFEWDLSQGNLIVDDDHNITLFDFGYMYSFDPLNELNSNGMNDPIFQSFERFETRFLSGWLCSQNLNDKDAITYFKIIKEEALKILKLKLVWLKENSASIDVIQHIKGLIYSYEKALKTPEALNELYIAEMFRSHVLDIEDDLGGKSCTATTKKRVKSVLEMLDKHYELLKKAEALFYQNHKKSQADLLKQYKVKGQLVNQYQLT
ncbi:AarF/UbiB family protein [Vibrio gallaecicus]|uniref:AarF/UbiB family protein n=1 Tax=Vibrio gallaecicus TaxID=552386 RepID=A0ABV4NCJ2_9VIBR